MSSVEFETSKSDLPAVLVTGGAGYIGSHACVALREAGFAPVILDNLSNSHPLVVSRIEALTGDRPAFYRADMADEAALKRILTDHRPVAVMHFAGLKTVAGSVANPIDTYNQNVSKSLKLLKILDEFALRRIVFSSSATVYGAGDVPIDEDSPIEPTNPYGRSKAMIEQVLKDLATTDHGWSIARLRYFNPVGAHPSGEIGEDPNGPPDNLFPYVSQVAIGRREVLNIFGDDFDTRDGTGVRDYIHIMDLVNGHILALVKLLETEGLMTVNLGTGKGYSVLEVIDAFARISGRTINTKIGNRRCGDVAASYADVRLARERIGFEARLGLDDMCRDAWNWQTKNPYGYRNSEPDAA